MKINLLLAIESMIASFRKKIIILYFDFGVWMIKKFLIIILLAFFMISAVSASEIDEATFNNHAETQIQEFAEANQIDIVEEISTDDIVEEDVVIHEDNSAPVKSNQVEYNDSNIIYNSENYNEIENYQYNESFKVLINETQEEF